MYLSFIRPVLEYADVVRGICSTDLQNDIEHIKKEAGRIVSGATNLTFKTY